MKKNLPTPVVVGIIVAVLIIVGIIYWVLAKPKGGDVEAGNLPPADATQGWSSGPVEVHQPPAGWSIDGGAAGPAQPGPQGN